MIPAGSTFKADLLRIRNIRQDKWEQNQGTYKGLECLRSSTYTCTIPPPSTMAIRFHSNNGVAPSLPAQNNARARELASAMNDMRTPVTMADSHCCFCYIIHIYMNFCRGAETLSVNGPLPVVKSAVLTTSRFNTPCYILPSLTLRHISVHTLILLMRYLTSLIGYWFLGKQSLHQPCL